MTAFLRDKGKILWDVMVNTAYVHPVNFLAPGSRDKFATNRREYVNFTHLPGVSIDAMFQRFTVIVNNMRANVAVLLYDDHDRAIKLLHFLDRTVWREREKVEAILESEKYENLTVDELFSKLKSSEVDCGVRAKIENPTDPHSLALVSVSRTNANMFFRHFFVLPCVHSR
jgi:hypothetical protein